MKFFSYVFSGIITLLSPLAHNSDESCGTDTKFRRMKILHDGKTLQIPIYSGNALRGILRRLIAKDFFERIGIEKLSDKLYYTFFCGGSLEKGSSQDYIEVGKKLELRETIPFISLFGSAIHNQIMQGKLQVGMAVPIAKETEKMTKKESTKSIWELTDEIFYTRRDDLEDKENDSQVQQMKYNIEVLISGTQLFHEFVLQDVNEVELSCFGHVIDLWKSDPILGGKAGTGHGKVELAYMPEFPNSKIYLDFLNENKDKIKEYIEKM